MTETPSLAELAERQDEVLPPKRGDAGTGVTVALVTAPVYRHPWFEGAVTGAVEDPGGRAYHGTFLAGLVLQRAPAARVIYCDAGVDEQGTTQDGAILAAISRAAEEAADVILIGLSASPGTGPPSKTFARVAARVGRLILAPAGHEGGDVTAHPASAEGIVAVYGLSPDGVGGWRRSSHSPPGDLGVPDVDLLTTGAPWQEDMGQDWRGFTRISGPSMAAALAAGEIAATMSRLGVDAKAALELVRELPPETFLERFPDNAAGTPPRLARPPELADPTTVVSDYWTTEDRLGYRMHADALASFILDPGTRPPLTIAVKGAWGSGKTSLLRMVQERLDPPAGKVARRIPLTSASGTELGTVSKSEPRLFAALKLMRRKNFEPIVGTRGTAFGTPVRTTGLQASAPSDVEEPRWRPTVWFNPWMYQTGEQVWAGLAHEIIRQVTVRMSTVDRERFWLALNLSRVDTEAVRRRIYRVVLGRLLPTVGWLAGLVAAGLGLALAKVPVGAWISPAGVSFGVIAVLLARVVGVLATQTSKLLPDMVKPPDVAGLAGGVVDDVADPRFRARAGFLHLVHNDVAAVLDLVASRERPLIVLVDDLDRCTASTVAQVIEALNLFLAGQFPHCVFIVAMEPTMVAAQLETAYGQTEEGSGPGIGWRFLDKLVQLAVSLPSPADAALRGFVSDTLSGGAVTASVNAPAPLSEARVRDIERGLAPVDSVDDVVSSAYGLEGVGSGQLSAEAREAVRRTTRRRLSAEDPETAAIIAAVTAHLSWNPREVKRFINLLRYYAAIRQEYLLAGAERELSIYQIAKLAVLAIRWPHLRGPLAGSTGDVVTLAAVEDALRANAPGSTKDRIITQGVDLPTAARLAQEPDLLRFLTADPPIGPSAIRYL